LPCSRGKVASYLADRTYNGGIKSAELLSNLKHQGKNAVKVPWLILS